MRWCSICKQYKLPCEFYRTRRDGLMRQCKVCHKARTTKWQRENPERRRDIRVRHIHGLEPDQYAAMEHQQCGLCAICQDKTKLVIDHDHKTGKVRGLLCDPCNLGIGKLKDSADICRAAASYLDCGDLA